MNPRPTGIPSRHVPLFPMSVDLQAFGVGHVEHGQASFRPGFGDFAVEIRQREPSPIVRVVLGIVIASRNEIDAFRAAIIDRR